MDAELLIKNLGPSSWVFNRKLSRKNFYFNSYSQFYSNIKKYNDVLGERRKKKKAKIILFFRGNCQFCKTTVFSCGLVFLKEYSIRRLWKGWSNYIKPYTERISLDRYVILCNKCMAFRG